MKNQSIFFAAIQLAFASLIPLGSPPVAAAASVPDDHAASMTKSRLLFTKHIRPLFIRSCVECHGGEKIRGGLNLNTRQDLLAGGDNGPAIIPGHPENNFLIEVVKHTEEPFMPKGDAPKLSNEEISHLTQWIATGAAYNAPLLADSEAADANGPMTITNSDRNFWSFKPLLVTNPPQTTNQTWSKSPIDRFIAASLEHHGLAPNRETDPQTLLRRLHFDLSGLPPTPNELKSFIRLFHKNPSKALESKVEQLLENPQFGEKWARHWLDVARFAESHGFEQDYDRPYAYHYRDFVIQALNKDMPFDQFVRWQLAGDELAPNDPLALMATGFLGAGVFPTQLTEKEFESARYDELDDMLATTGTAFLGLTIGCARCHDHKYDPIPVADYYRLLSTFTTTIRSEIHIKGSAKAAREYRKSWDQKRIALENKIKARPATDSDLKKLKKELAEHLEAKPPEGTVKVQVTSEGYPPTKHHADGRGFPHFYPETHHLNRGDVAQKGEVATQGFLQVLLRNSKTEAHWQSPPPHNARTSHRRAALADWMTDTKNGAGHLLARVIVNRLWHHHFGQGIVTTPGDFGLQGARPTHPELLDFLANQLIENGWRLKPLHKQIVLSAAYRQSSESHPTHSKIDPNNHLLWRFTPRRLEAEQIRDSLLAISETLDLTMFGPGSLDPANPRRSIYLTIKRSQLVPMMQVFDSPEPLVSQAARPSTTIAPQALVFMNNPSVRDWIDTLAANLLKITNDSPNQAVTNAYRSILNRPPSPQEIEESLAFMAKQAADYEKNQQSDSEKLALGDLCQVLVSLNEFIYLN
ncbi:MAG: PSD1 and planctomycete cytochrome C domain-containing protein [Verrucomicrobiota bacterium]